MCQEGYCQKLWVLYYNTAKNDTILSQLFSEGMFSSLVKNRC